MTAKATPIADLIPQHVEQVEALRQRVKELENGLACSPSHICKVQYLEEQLAASQHYAQQLRDALETCQEGVYRDNGFEVLRKDYDADLVREALSRPHDTSALDALVKDAYELGWRVCAKWAKRNELHFDVGLEAYCKERDAAIDSAMKAKGDQSNV
jgi:hypothetical protein